MSWDCWLNKPVWLNIGPVGSFKKYMEQPVTGSILVCDVLGSPSNCHWENHGELVPYKELPYSNMKPSVLFKQNSTLAYRVNCQTTWTLLLWRLQASTSVLYTYNSPFCIAKYPSKSAIARSEKNINKHVLILNHILLLTNRLHKEASLCSPCLF